MLGIIADAKTGITRPIDDLEPFPHYAPDPELPALDILETLATLANLDKRLKALEPKT